MIDGYESATDLLRFFPPAYLIPAEYRWSFFLESWGVFRFLFDHVLHDFWALELPPELLETLRFRDLLLDRCSLRFLLRSWIS